MEQDDYFICLKLDFFRLQMHRKETNRGQVVSVVAVVAILWPSSLILI